MAGPLQVDPTTTPKCPSAGKETELAAASGERRQVTALFADMVGLTAISERLSEEGACAPIQSIHALIADAVQERGGTVSKFTGDGIMAMFGVPAAREDARPRTCHAACITPGLPWCVVFAETGR